MLKKKFEELQEKAHIIRPTVTQAFCLAMSDYIHPKCKNDPDMSDNVNVFMHDGTRGSGKSDLAVMEIEQQVSKGFGSFFKAVVFRKNMADLKDFMDKCEYHFRQMGYDFKMNRGNSSPELKFATGEVVLFRMLRNIDDYNKHHGANYQMIIFEEGTIWAEIKELMLEMMSCLRSPYNELFKNEIKNGTKKKLVLKVRVTTNPFGAGKDALKKLFVDKQKEGRPFIRNGITWCRFISTFLDNPYINDTYINNFLSLPNKNKVRAWVYGDWEAENSSAAFGSIYRSDKHQIPLFKIPLNWRVNRSMDWGTRDPYSVLWWAEADGEEVEYEHFGQIKTFCPPRGSLILINELYGCNTKVSRNTGTRETASRVAKRIKQIESHMYNNLLEEGHHIEDGPADNNIRNDNGNENTIEDLFEQEGVYWEKSNKTKGSRINGVNIMIDMLQNTVDSNERKHIYIMGSNCPNFLEDVFALEYDEKVDGDVLTHGVPDHSWDACRYRLLQKLYDEGDTDYDF